MIECVEELKALTKERPGVGAAAAAAEDDDDGDVIEVGVARRSGTFGTRVQRLQREGIPNPSRGPTQLGRLQ